MVPLGKTYDTCPALSVLDSLSEGFWALAVGEKDPIKFVVDWMVEKLDDAGCRGQKLTIKSDGEAAAVALEKAVAAARTGITALIQFQVRESKANGAVEVAVKTFQGQLHRLAIGHPSLEWLVMWSAETLLKFRKGIGDGRSSYEAITGHRCKHPVMFLGEAAMLRVAPDKSDRHKADTAWVEGIFVGIGPRSSEFRMVTDTGIYKTSYHNVKRVTTRGPTK